MPQLIKRRIILTATLIISSTRSCVTEPGAHLRKKCTRVCTKTQLYSAQQIIKSREFGYYLAGVGSGNEQLQSLSFQLREPSIAVLTPYHSFTARRASAARGGRAGPETRGAAQRAGRFSPNSRRDGSRRSREGARWGDPRAWGRGACGAGHGAGALWSRTSAGAGTFIVSFSVPRVRKEGRRFGRGRVRHLRRAEQEMKRSSTIKPRINTMEMKSDNLAVHIDSYWIPVLCLIDINLHYVRTTAPFSGKTTGCTWKTALCSFKSKRFASTQPDSVSQLFHWLISCLWLRSPHSCGWIQNKWKTILGMNHFIPVPHV